jgi:hypothetical protein
MFIIIHGSPLDGYQFIGPFETEDEAETWGKMISGDDSPLHGWWAVAPVDPPT